LFGDGPQDRAQYANWRTRARIINHYRFSHPATINGLMGTYRLARDSNPAIFALERGWQIGSGKEMFTGLKVSRLQAGLELLLSIGVVKLLGLRSKPNRMTTDSEVAEAESGATPARQGKTANEVKGKNVDRRADNGYIKENEAGGPKKTEKEELPPPRQAYVDEVSGLSERANQMRKAGVPPEQIARNLHAERNTIKVKYRKLTPADILEKIEQRNLQKYGDKLGPSIEQLRESGKSWDYIIESATRSGGKDLGY
jgi:hypothetical protein